MIATIIDEFNIGTTNKLIDVIKNTKAYPYPSGTPNAFMHYSRVFIRGKEYNLEVLYHVPTNTIYHFEYARDAMGSLSVIIK